MHQKYCSGWPGLYFLTKFVIIIIPHAWPLSVYLSIYLWLYSSWLDLGLFLFSFLILYTVGRTPWTGDQPVARPLPAHRTAQTQNKRTQTSMPRVEYQPTTRVQASENISWQPAQPMWSAPDIYLTKFQESTLSGGLWLPSYEVARPHFRDLHDRKLQNTEILTPSVLKCS
jgi:hypothetical protein